MSGQYSCGALHYQALVSRGHAQRAAPCFSSQCEQHAPVQRARYKSGGQLKIFVEGHCEGVGSSASSTGRACAPLLEKGRLYESCSSLFEKASVLPPGQEATEYTSKVASTCDGCFAH